jgi:uncharacterized membrane protein
LPLGDTALAFLGSVWAVGILSVMVIVESVVDQLPSTASRTVPVQFGGRIVTAALSGATIAASAGSMLAGGIAGIVGAVIGTLGGLAARTRLAAAFGKDAPAGFIEDAVAIVAAVVVIMVLR